MWITDKNISKLIPVFTSPVYTRTDFINKTPHNIYTVSSNAENDNYSLYALKFKDYNTSYFNNLNVNYKIVDIFDNDSYKPTSLNIIENSKSYIVPFTGIESSKILDLYIFTDSTSTLNLDLELTVSSINKYSDIYSLLNSEYNIKNLTFKESYFLEELSVSKEFLENAYFTVENIVKITYSLSINLSYTQNRFFNCIAESSRYNIKLFSNAVEDLYELDSVRYQEDIYYAINDLDSIKSKSAIVNEDSIVLIL